MGIAPQDILDLSRQIEAIGGESAWRSASSRAYYAAYHHAYRWHSRLAEAGAAPAKQVGEHLKLVHQLQNPGSGNSAADSRSSEKLGILLDKMRIRRGRADYEIADPYLLGAARGQILDATSILSNWT